MEKYRCDTCKKFIDEKDIEEHDETGRIHIVPCYDKLGDIEPDACGPITENPIIQEIGPAKIHLFACVKDYHGTPFKAYHMASFKTFHLATLYVMDVLEQTIELDYITIVDDSHE